MDGSVVHKNVWLGLDKAFNHKCSQPGWGGSRKKGIRGKREAERDGVNKREGRMSGKKESKQKLRKKKKVGV